MEDKFTIIFKEMHTELKRFTFSKIQNKADAEDILQEIYVKIYRNIDTVDNLENLKPWIYKVTNNTIIDYYRSKKLSTIDIDKLQIAEIDELNQSFNEEISSCLHKFLVFLSNDDSEIIEMYHYKQMKHQEISKQLNISVASSKMRLSRARKRLQKLLLECCIVEKDKYGNIIDYQAKNKDKFC